MPHTYPRIRRIICLACHSGLDEIICVLARHQQLPKDAYQSGAKSVPAYNNKSKYVVGMVLKADSHVPAVTVGAWWDCKQVRRDRKTRKLTLHGTESRKIRIRK